jgi:response regulator NasT
MLRIMLVDDSHKEVGLLKDALHTAGHDVVTAHAAELGMPDRIRALGPDVIIVGSDSPNREVLDCIAAMTARDPRPVVLFTDERRQDTIQAALRAGVSAYVVAGIHRERLQSILDVAVARFAQDQALREELREAHEKLAERKTIERAKGFLMEQKNVSEEEAYRLLRKLAMDRNLKMLDVARHVIDVARLLS